MKHILVVGAGFAGCVVARELAACDYKVMIIDKREHLGGNAHTARDPSTGVMVHTYGPHIFNTDDEEVWLYVSRYTLMRQFKNRVKAVNRRGVFSFPINLHTINQFFNSAMDPTEAQKFIASLCEDIPEPQNFEEQALSMIGRDLYEAFMKFYTMKQWGRSPLEIPASVLTRLPLRFNYDDNYYQTRLQGIPTNGYTEIFQKMADHKNINVMLSQPFYPGMITNFEHVFYTGPIDEFYQHAFGRLSYRTVTFERFEGAGDLQGNAVLNYTDDSRKATRSHEHKHFAPWETHDRSVLFVERSKETGPEDTPYYPVRTDADKELLQSYQDEAQKESKVTFLGRLGGYRYMNMDQTIREALNVSRKFIHERRSPGQVRTIT